MLKLFIGNKAYSSWSMRGWLAVRQSGLAFEEILVPLYDSEWGSKREGHEYSPSSGKVPILWDDDTVVWQSLAIIEYLAEKSGQDKFWPTDMGARAVARAMATEMQCGFVELRRKHPMNIRRIYQPQPLDPLVAKDCERIFSLWADARSRFGSEGDFLFGQFGAVDIMFAPVVTRLATYSIPMPRFAQAYCHAVYSNKAVQDWIAGAQEEPWILEQYEAEPVAS